MDAIVHDDEPSGTSCIFGVTEPRVQENGDVVVPVEEDQGLFPKHYEYGVAQLWKLTQNKHPRPESGHLILFYEGRNANRVVQAVMGEGVEKLGHRSACPHYAERRQQRVPQD